MEVYDFFFQLFFSLNKKYFYCPSNLFILMLSAGLYKESYNNLALFGVLSILSLFLGFAITRTSSIIDCFIALCIKSKHSKIKHKLLIEKIYENNFVGKHFLGKLLLNLSYLGSVYLTGYLFGHQPRLLLIMISIHTITDIARFIYIFDYMIDDM